MVLLTMVFGLSALRTLKQLYLILIKILDLLTEVEVCKRISIVDTDLDEKIYQTKFNLNKMRVLIVNGNKIEIDLLSLFTGTETIYYNEEVVSKKKSFWGSVHAFRVKENGADTQYEIKIGISFPIRPTIEIKRNSELLYSDNYKSSRKIQL